MIYEFLSTLALEKIMSFATNPLATRPHATQAVTCVTTFEFR
jgi:hypothetical protein